MYIKINLFLGDTMDIYVSVLLRHEMNSKVFYIFMHISNYLKLKSIIET